MYSKLSNVNNGAGYVLTDLGEEKEPLLNSQNLGVNTHKLGYKINPMVHESNANQKQNTSSARKTNRIAWVFAKH